MKAELHNAFEGEIDSRLRGNDKFWQLVRILSQSLRSTHATLAAEHAGLLLFMQVVFLAAFPGRLDGNVAAG